MNQFWSGFEKRAKGPLAEGLGLLAGGSAFAGLHKAIAHGLENPYAGKVSKGLASVVHKAQEVHPALGPATAWGLPALGGAATWAAVRHGIGAYEKRFTPKPNIARRTIERIKELIRKYKDRAKTHGPEKS